MSAASASRSNEPPLSSPTDRAELRWAEVRLQLALAQIKANLDARKADPAIARLAWNFYPLRRAWNQAKHQVAPWWRCSSKEVYASGIADLVAPLGNWSDLGAI